MSDQLLASLLAARAWVLHDLEARGRADAAAVSIMENALSQRTWWLEQWPDGAGFVPGLVAQDVQDALLDASDRWPLCTACDLEAIHALTLEPELGEDPHWICDESGIVVAPLGGLS